MPSAATAPTKEDKENEFAVFLAKKCRDYEKQVKSYKKLLEEGKHEDLESIEEKHKLATSRVGIYKELKQQLKKCSVNGKKIVFAEEEEESEPEQKKSAEKYSAFEVRKIQMVLKNQATLNYLQNPKVREDFLEGRNGAIKLTESNMEDLDNLYKLITPPALEDKPTTNEEFLESLLECAKHLFNLTEGKSKEDTKDKIVYRGVRQLVHKVSLCNYSPVFNHSQEEEAASSDLVEDQATPSSDEVCNSPSINEVKNDSPNIISDEDRTPNISSEPVISNQNVPNKVPQNGIETPSLPTPSPQPSVNIQNSRHSISSNNNSNTYQEHIVLPNLQPDPVTFNQDHHLLHSKVMTVKNFMMTRNLTFLQDHQLPGKEIYMDPAVVTFGSIKPDCYMNMDEVHVDDALSEGKVEVQERGEMAQFEEDLVRKPAVIENSNLSSQVFMSNKFEKPEEVVSPSKEMVELEQLKHRKEMIEQQLEHDVNVEPRSPTELPIGRMEFVNPKYQQNLSHMVSSPNYHGMGPGPVPVPQNHMVNLNQIQHSLMQSPQNAPSAVPDEYHQEPMKIKEEYSVQQSKPQEPLKISSWADDKDSSFSSQSDSRNGNSHQVDVRNIQGNSSNVQIDNRNTNNMQVDSRNTNNIQVDSRNTNNIQVDSRNSSNIQVDSRNSSNIPVDSRNSSNVQVDSRNTNNMQVDSRNSNNMQVDGRSGNNMPVDSRNGWTDDNKSYNRNDEYDVWDQDMQWHDPEKEERSGYRGGRGNRRPSGPFRGRSFSNSQGPRGAYNNNGYRGGRGGGGYRGRPNYRNNGNPRGNGFRGQRGSYSGDGQRGYSDGPRGNYSGDSHRGSYGGDGSRGSYGGDGSRGSYGGDGPRGNYGDGHRGSYSGDGHRGSYSGDSHRGSYSGNIQRN